MTRKIVSEMTYNVSMGTLNPTIPYHTYKQRKKQTINVLVSNGIQWPPKPEVLISLEL